MKLAVLLFIFSLSIAVHCQAQKDSVIKGQIESRSYDSALTTLRIALSESPESAWLLRQKAICEYNLYRWDSAIVSSTIGISCASTTDTLYDRLLYFRSLCYEKAGKYDSAIFDNERLVIKLNHEPKYFINLARLYDITGKLDDCLSTLKRAYDVDSSNVYTLNNLSYYSDEAHQYQKAIYYADKGLNLTIDSTWVGCLLNNKGLAEAMLFSSETGMATIKKSLSYRPSSAFAYYNIGLIFLKDKQYEIACINFKKAKELGGVMMTMPYLEKYCK